jgi:hypothetical protein
MQSMSGVAHVPSAPLSGSTVVTGTGPSVMADGVSDASYLITNACNAPPTSPFPWPNPHSVPDQTFRVRQNGNLIFEDVSATYVVTRAGRPDIGAYPNGDPWIVPTEVIASGSQPAGSWTLTMTNIRWDAAHEKLVMDFSLTASAGLIQSSGGGEGGGEDPPIIRQ